MRTVALLTEKKQVVENMAQALLAKEVLNLDAVEEVLGKRPFENATLQNIDRYRFGRGSATANAAAAAAEGAEAEAAGGGEGGGGSGDSEGGSGGAKEDKGEEKGDYQGVDPGMVVAT